MSSGQPLKSCTPFMFNRLPVRTSVGFRGVDWAVEAEKSNQGFERRTKEQRRRARKKTQRRMSNNVQLSKSFLQYVVSSEESEKGNPISLMSHCTLFLEQVENAGVVAFSEGSSNVEKVRLSLEKFEDMKTKPMLLLKIESWMYTAAEEGLYSLQPEPSSPSSDGRGSSVSGLTEGTFETISLSSHHIDDAVAAEIIQAGVFAAYVAGKHRGHAHKCLCEDFSKIFQTKQPEYIAAMVTAEKKTDWSEFDNGDGEACVGSHSSKSCMDELASGAYTAVFKKADELGLTESQIKKLKQYCFIPLQRD